MSPKLPLSLCITKQAGILSSASEGALLGLLLGIIARRIPALASLRLNNPAVYDAALGASVASASKALNQHDERPQLLPGQDPGHTTIQAPPWNLM